MKPTPVRAIALFSGLLAVLGSNAAIAKIVLETQRWAPGIGDPTIAGWVTVGVYLFVTVQSAANAGVARANRKEAWIWTLVTLFMGFLAVNKQLDLQSWFTQFGRDIAKAQGWYDLRRGVQTAVVAALAATMVGGILLLRKQIADRWSRFGSLVIGLSLLSFFIATRAATIHHIDWLLGLSVSMLKVNNVLELGALLFCAYGAWDWRRQYVRLQKQTGVESHV
jgi:hypothetical protein